jgi:hypothetical protein
MRLAGVLFAVAVMGQAVFAGLFVTGDLTMLDMHQVNAIVVAGSALLWIVAAIPLGRRLIMMGVVALVLTVVQMAVGGAHILWLHIPLGVGMFAMAVWFATTAFTYGKEKP